MVKTLKLIKKTYPVIVYLPPIVLLYWIISFGVDLPFYDEWIFMGSILKEQLKGDFNLYDFFTPHNDHRIFTTYVTFAILEHLGAWNRWYFFFLNFATALGTFLLISKYFIKSSTDKHPYLLLFIVGLLHFGAMQLENWTWGFQIQWFHCSFFSLLTLIFLCVDRSSKFKFIFAVCSAILTSLTIAGGLFIWVAGLCVCIHQSLRKCRSWIYSVAWAVIGGITWYLYQQGLSERHLLSSFWNEPFLAVKTFLTLIGASIVNFNWIAALIVGVIGVTLFLYLSFYCIKLILIQSRLTLDTDGFILWYSWSFFCVISSIAIALARFTMGGPSYVIEASRYTTLTTPFWIGLVLSFPYLKIKVNNKFLSFVFIMFLIGYFQTTKHSIAAWEYREKILKEARSVILSYDAELLSQFDEPKVFIKRIGFINEETIRLLKDRKLSPFSQNQIDLNLLLYPSSSNSPSGYIDAVDEIKAPSGEIVTQIRGWALDPLDTRRGDVSVVITNNQEILAEVPAYVLRPDVNQTHHLDSSIKSGWQLFIASTNINPKDINAYLISKDRTKAFKLNKNPALLSPD